MKSEKELFELAKMYVMLSSEFDRELLDFERDEIKESMEEIRTAVLEKGYDADRFVRYQQLYKDMSISEYIEFVKTLE